MSRLKPRPTKTIYWIVGRGINHAANIRASPERIDAASSRSPRGDAGAPASGRSASAANHGHFADGEGSAHYRAGFRPVAGVPEIGRCISPIVELPRGLVADGQTAGGGLCFQQSARSG